MLENSEFQRNNKTKPQKIKALLKQFGSVEKIKQASIEELMKVKGITKELAESLKQQNEKR